MYSIAFYRRPVDMSGCRTGRIVLHLFRRYVQDCVQISVMLAALSLCCTPGNGQPSSQRHSTSSGCDTSIYCAAEELVYEVSWMKVKLGQIRLKTLRSTIDNDGMVRHHGVAYVDSYEGVPFVDLHAVSRTEMDGSFYSRGFQSVEKKDDNRWLAETSHYNLPGNTIIIEKVFQRQKNSAPISQASYDTLHIMEKQLEDGLSILYFARANVRHNGTVAIPTVVYGRKGRTLFNFTGTSTSEEIDAMENKRVRVIAFEGRAEFKGIFGFTGDFKGWMSDDPAAIPMKAELKVLLGSVKLELVSWKRDGWSPPTLDRE